MDEKEVQNYRKRMAEFPLPLHLKEVARRLRISCPTASKVVSVLEARGEIETKRLGCTWLVIGVKS